MSQEPTQQEVSNARWEDNKLVLLEAKNDTDSDEDEDAPRVAVGGGVAGFSFAPFYTVDQFSSFLGTPPPTLDGATFDRDRWCITYPPMPRREFHLPTTVRLPDDLEYTLSSTDQLCRYVKGGGPDCHCDLVKKEGGNCKPCSWRATVTVTNREGDAVKSPFKLTTAGLLGEIIFRFAVLPSHLAPSTRGKGLEAASKEAHDVGTLEDKKVYATEASSAHNRRIADWKWYYQFPCGFKDCDARLFVGALHGDTTKLVLLESAVGHRHMCAPCFHGTRHCTTCCVLPLPEVSGGGGSGGAGGGSGGTGGRGGG
eukprot:CAMPEP_0197599238 /NCGR_PEP_ID=MMETSP1326-20131121/30920_1 /TAXON_ID=1155430 /ORGANISM="Genus nov. species nov., Strain RCC2288" /LENGTH=311 /DNA_ID=CAMNT_0043166167 /DNA_START=569 /DNA_END=1500 /DNA_ORIENTATION=+